MRLDRSDLELEVIYRRIEDGELDLQPDFQRGEVWSTERRQRLIDTILRQWYVPAVHLIADETRGIDVVLDGQQRLVSVREFFSGRMRVDGQQPPFDAEIVELDGMTYPNLPVEVQKRVRRFPVTVVTLFDFDPDEPYELFFRLNQHQPLTPSEKRNALYGQARHQVKGIVSELTTSGLLSRDAVGFSNGRLAYDDVFARLCLAVQAGDLSLPITNGRIEDFYRNEKFTDVTLESVQRSATEFLASASTCGVKFNKATLFSWLVFAYTLYRIGAAPPDPTWITAFESDRLTARHTRTSSQRTLALHSGEWLQATLAVFNDRASYRVADTLSVLLRDVILHVYAVVYRGIEFPSLVGGWRGESNEPLRDLADRLRHADSPAEFTLVDFVERSNWGRLP